MPLPSWARPHGPHARIYTEAGFGQLARIFVLDDRQYRSYHVCPRAGRAGSNTINSTDCPQRLSPELTLLGAEQERWLYDALAKSTARWNIIAQQTLMAQSDRGPLSEQRFWTDGWDGYPKARERLLTAVAQHKVSNPLVLGGDVHTAVVADLKINFDDAKAPVIATEILGPSITSRGPTQKQLDVARYKNPHIRWANAADRGYASLDMSADRCVAHMRAVSSVNTPNATMRDLATFTVANGKAGAQPL